MEELEVAQPQRTHEALSREPRQVPPEGVSLRPQGAERVVSAVS